MSGVSFTVDAEVAFINLLDEGQANTLSIDILRDILAFLTENKPAKFRALIIRSSSEVFCTGMDFNSFQDAAEYRSQLANQSAKMYATLLKEINSLPCLSIAVVRGACRAGGLGLAAACDFIACGPKASFELGENLFGLIPANVIPYLSQRLSMQKMKRMIIGLERFNANAALQVGLSDFVANDDAELEKKLQAIIRNALRCNPNAVAATKSFIDKLALVSKLDDKSLLAQKKLADLLQGNETRIGIASFLGGETPPWFAKNRPKISLAIAREEHE